MAVALPHCCTNLKSIRPKKGNQIQIHGGSLGNKTNKICLCPHHQCVLVQATSKVFCCPSAAGTLDACLRPARFAKGAAHHAGKWGATGAKPRTSAPPQTIGLAPRHQGTAPAHDGQCLKGPARGPMWGVFGVLGQQKPWLWLALAQIGQGTNKFCQICCQTSRVGHNCQKLVVWEQLFAPLVGGGCCCMWQGQLQGQWAKGMPPIATCSLAVA